MIELDLPQINPPTTAPIRELLTPLPQTGHYLLILDNSAVECITKCPTAAFDYLVLKREAHRRDSALTFGGALHEGIRDLLLGKSGAEQDSSIVQYFAQNPSPPDEYRTPTMALRVIEHYRLRYDAMTEMQFSVLRDEGDPLVEVPFEIPLTGIEVNTKLKLPDWPEPRLVKNISVAYSGRIDLVALKNGKNVIVDHKTTSITGEQFIQSFHLSNQAMGYVWAASKLWPELNISNFCLNAIALRRVKDDTANIMAQGIRGGEPPLSFFQNYYSYTPEQLEYWEENVTTIISDFIHCLVRDFFPMYTHSCFNKYGKCAYWDACTLENKKVRRQFLLSDNFKPVTWNPTL